MKYEHGNHPLVDFRGVRTSAEQAEPGERVLRDGEVIESPPADLEHANFSKLIYHLPLDALAACSC